MNNLLSYCGLDDAKIRASDKDLPVRIYNLLYGLLTFQEGVPKLKIFWPEINKKGNYCI